MFNHNERNLLGSLDDFFIFLGFSLSALARQSGQDEDEAVRHLWGKLAILLQRGNAAILGNRVPDFPAPAIDGRY